MYGKLMPIDYSYYPFLKRALAHHITELNEQAILYATEHIDKYTRTHLVELDLTVWLSSTIILKNLQNNYLLKKFVSNYGKLFESIFGKDIKNKSIRNEILDYFEIDRDIEFIIIRKQEHIKIHVMDYLEIQQYVFAPQFKLVNQTLSKAFIYIELPQFTYLLRSSLEQRLIAKIKSMKSYTDNDLINQSVTILRTKYPPFNKLLAPGKDNIPQSIQEIIDKAYRDHHLNHRERLKLGIYLQKNNFDMDYILEIFKQLSNYSEKTTLYQLRSLNKYT